MEIVGSGVLDLAKGSIDNIIPGRTGEKNLGLSIVSGTNIRRKRTFCLSGQPHRQGGREHTQP